MRVIVGVLLVVHGLITMALSAGSFNPQSAGVPNPAWLSWWPAPMGKSWIFSLIGQSRAAAIEPYVGVLWLIAGAAIVAAGLGVLGFIVPVAYWRVLAGFGAALSLLVVVLYAHPFYAVGTAANVAILVVLLWAKWPTSELLGS